MLGFVNNNLHISNLFLESLEKKYVPWISKDNKVFYISTQTMCKLDLVGDNIFWKSAKFID